MNDSIKEGLEGLSKMDGVSNFLYALMYWVEKGCYMRNHVAALVC